MGEQGAWKGQAFVGLYGIYDQMMPYGSAYPSNWKGVIWNPMYVTDVLFRGEDSSTWMWGKLYIPCFWKGPWSPAEAMDVRLSLKNWKKSILVSRSNQSAPGEAFWRAFINYHNAL